MFELLWGKREREASAPVPPTQTSRGDGEDGGKNGVDPVNAPPLSPLSRATLVAGDASPHDAAACPVSPSRGGVGVPVLPTRGKVAQHVVSKDGARRFKSVRKLTRFYHQCF